MKDLSILIPARNEMFLARTIEDILEHAESDFEIIAVLDGVWADPGLSDNDRVKIIYYPESIGQREATNKAALLSEGKYLMKVDAHCSFDQGFDKQLLKTIKGHDDWTIVPIMRNLHAFNWVCKKGHTRYQGPSGECKECGEPTERDVCWIGKRNPQSTSYCFDSEPHFQYFKQWNKRPEGSGKLTETMSLQGSCFMLKRDKYFELNICDADTFGSWGSQGIEVACKTWLSGGSVMVDHNTWYAHMFRTQGGDFSFPYKQHQSKVNFAKKAAKELFFNNKWDKQVRPLSWLLDKFWPVQGWTDEERHPITVAGEKFYKEKGIKKEEPIIMKPKKGIIYYTDNQLKVKVAHAVQKQLRNTGLPIVSASLKPMTNMGKNIHVKMERGYLAMFKQILAALEASDAEYIFLCEHDVLYHPSHFDFTPPTRGKFYYNVNWWRVRYDDRYAVSWEARQVSGLCADRNLLINHYKKRVALVEKFGYKSAMGFEPGSHNDPDQHGYRERGSMTPEIYIDDVMAENWMSKEPNIDIKHGKNLSKNKWSLKDFRDKKTATNFRVGECPEWGKDLF